MIAVDAMWLWHMISSSYEWHINIPAFLFSMQCKEADLSLRMAPILTWILFFHFFIHILSFDPNCTLQNDLVPGFIADGDFVIGGIFPFHYNQEMPDSNYMYKPGPVKCNGYNLLN